MSSNAVKKCGNSQDCHEVNHLCQIIIRHDLGRIRELIKDSQYYCKNCGRSAKDKDNLCNPSKI